LTSFQSDLQPASYRTGNVVLHFNRPFMSGDDAILGRSISPRYQLLVLRIVNQVLKRGQIPYPAG